ncbi:MAG: ATP-binding protein, partial [Bdellovibrionota bacterium]
MRKSDQPEVVDCDDIRARLRIVEHRLAALRGTDLLAVTYFNEDGSIHEPNQKFLEMFDLKPEGVSSFDWRNTEIEVWKEQTRQALFEMLHEGKMVSFLKESRTNSGRTIPISVSIAPLDGSDDYDAVALTYDLTELIEAREEADHNRHKADLALEAAKIGLWEFDLTSKRCEWDERCSHMLGLRVSEIRDLDCFDGRISKEDIARIRDTMLVAIEGEFGHSQTVEFKINVRGREKILCATGRAYQMSRETAPRLTGTLTDVTGSRKYEQRLFESEDRFRTMAEAIPQIVFEANPLGEIEWVNRKFFEYTGLHETSSPSDEGIASAIHPDDLESMREYWKQITTAGRSLDLQYRLRAVSGDYRWFMVRALPVVDGQGRIQRWVGSCTDIDAQKRLGDELKAAKEAAERASRMKGNFLANMSHEIRTPLGAILGFTDLLADPDIKDGERAEFLRIITRNGETLSRIVDDILDLSKVEAGMLALEKAPFQPSVLAKEVADLFSESARAKGLELKFFASPNMPANLVSDSTRIRQIVSNLVSNAIKFTERGHVEILVGATAKEWTVRVCDTGIGISPEQLSRLFKPFAQGDDSMNRKFGGTGLGLHLSRRLAEALGGELSIEASGEGYGSCFTLALPVELATQPMEAGPPV